MSAYRDLAIEAHTLLQQSESYAAYAAMVVRRYTSYDTWTKWIVATASCAPFINQLRSSATDTATWYTALVPLLALALPLVSFSKVIQLASELHGHHAELLPQLKKLFRDIKLSSEYAPETALLIDGWKRDLNDLDNRISEFRPKKASMPDIEFLKTKAESECEKFLMPTFIDLPLPVEPSIQLQQMNESSVVSPQAESPVASNTSKPEKVKQKTNKNPSSNGNGKTVLNYYKNPPNKF